MKMKYLWIVLVVFAAEILIATVFSRIGFVRSYLGDILVVILLYYFVKIFRDVPPLPLAIGVFAFACIVEVTQYFHLADQLGFERGSLASILLGNSFSWMDLMAYFLGSFGAYLSDTFLCMGKGKGNPK
jgi:hypothetical protein